MTLDPTHSQTISGHPLSLGGKTVFVLGGSSGIGLAVATKAAAAGARLLLIARDAAKLEAAAAAFQWTGTEVHTGAMDATETELKRFCDTQDGIDHAVSMLGGATPRSHACATHTWWWKSHTDIRIRRTPA